MLNVKQDKDHSSGCLYVQGGNQYDIPGVIGHEAMVERMSLGWPQPKSDEEPEELPTTIVLRADQSTAFKRGQLRDYLLPGKRLPQVRPEDRHAGGEDNEPSNERPPKWN